jgi:type IV pilus assembly protein PilP
MTRLKTTAKWMAMLAMSFCLAPIVWAQNAPPKKKPGVHKPKAAAVAAHAKNPEASAAAPAPGKGGKAEPEAGKRDPFLPLVNEKKAGGPPLPPGKAGLVIATVRVDGTVRSPNGMLAVVTNPDERTYFIREGDRLYDGDVEKIGLDGVTFKENSKDAFGKPVERMVTKRIYPSAGDQQ